MDIINLLELDGSNGFRLDGEADSLWRGKRGDHSGFSVSGAGDVNGDGFDDVIIGAPHANPSRYGDGFPLGSSYVVFGKASGFNAATALSTLDGNNGFRLDGGTTHILEQSGFSVSGAGDVNGDGYDDVIVGAPAAASYYGDSIDGFSYVVLGKASGFSAALDLSKSDFGMSGGYESHLGLSVSGAGDINGDGFDDLIIGTNGAMYSSYAVFGEASGFKFGFGVIGDTGYRSVSDAGDVNGDGIDDFTVGNSVIFGRNHDFGTIVDVANLDGSNGFRLGGLGVMIISAGDVNGDGFDDVIAGGADVKGDGSGSSYVVFGRASGFSATLDVANLNEKSGFRVDGAVAGDNTGSSVSGAGDVNGDGFDDLIIGAPGTSPNGDTQAGSSYVIFGRASGFGTVLDLANLDEKYGFRLDGAVAGDKAGFSVSGAGDVNGDGFDDLIVGAPESSPNDITQAGSSYVIFGRSDFGGGELPTIPGTSGNDVLRGTLAAEMFEAGDGNDLLIGRGGADVFHGGAGSDQIKVPDLNFQSIDGGAGSDVLQLTGKELNIDLSALDDQIHNVETICLYGRGDNTLTLTAESLLNLSDSTNTLKVHGNSGDRITVLDDGWIDGGSRGFYHTYTHDDAVLLVGANVAIDFV